MIGGLIEKEKRRLLEKKPGKGYAHLPTAAELRGRTIKVSFRETEPAQHFLDLGFHISFSGVITFVKEYEELVSFVPLDRILPETDAPFATPTPYRGTRNHPEYVLEVVKKVAEVKGLSFEDTQKQLLENTKNLFLV